MSSNSKKLVFGSAVAVALLLFAAPSIIDYLIRPEFFRVDTRLTEVASRSLGNVSRKDFYNALTSTFRELDMVNVCLDELFGKPFPKGIESYSDEERRIQLEQSLKQAYWFSSKEPWDLFMENHRYDMCATWVSTHMDTYDKDEGADENLVYISRLLLISRFMQPEFYESVMSAVAQKVSVPEEKLEDMMKDYTSWSKQ